VVALFPAGLLLVAVGVNGVLARPGVVEVGDARTRWKSRVWGGAAVAALLASFALGPIPHVYYRPNNFMGHSAFLESFATPDWSHSYRSEMMPDGPVIAGPGQLSAFYQRLALDTRPAAIVEYPMFVGNHFNLHYYAQHLHRKRVLIGYFPQLDVVLSRARETGRVKMSNMVDVTDAQAVRRSEAAYLVLHRHPARELLATSAGEAEQDYPPVTFLVNAYSQELGPPVFEDANLVVFRVTDGRRQ
jgi:hypothetical protein